MFFFLAVFLRSLSFRTRVCWWIHTDIRPAMQWNARTGLRRTLESKEAQQAAEWTAIVPCLVHRCSVLLQVAPVCNEVRTKRVTWWHCFFWKIQRNWALQMRLFIRKARGEKKLWIREIASWGVSRYRNPFGFMKSTSSRATTYEKVFTRISKDVAWLCWMLDPFVRLSFSQEAW